MVTEIEKQSMISCCLQCPIGKQVISDYILLFYRQWNQKKDKFTPDEHIINSIKKIAAPLELHFDFEQARIREIKKRKNAIEKEYRKAINILFKLSNGEKIPYSVFPERYNCVTTIKWILHSIIDICKCADLEPTFNKDTYYVIHKMEEIACSELLERAKAKYLKSAYKGEEEFFNSVIEKYCSTAIQYKFCNADFNCFEDYGKLRDCRSEMFNVLVNMQDQRTTLDYEGLSHNSMQIFHEYIMSVPKSFGHNLSRIMQIQGVTHQDLAKVFDVSASAIQSLCKSEKPSSPQIEIKKLAQVLLISEEVLYYGSGKIYGIWDDIIGEIDLQTLPFNCYVEAKVEKRQVLSYILDLTEHDFEKLLKDTPNVFCEKPYSLYVDNFEGEYYYNYFDMYKWALHPQEINILISVLRKCQAEKSD